jgi:HAD superfamily hydrolase (TIGR01509 family)
MKARGLFLDLDGTLADSMRVLRAATIQFMAQHGIDQLQGDFGEFAGRTSYDIMRVIKERHHLQEPLPELVDDYYALVEDSYQKQAGVMPGGRELLAAAQSQGVFTVVVTSTRRSVADGFLRQQRLQALIKGVVAAEDINRGKPDPEPFVKALSLSGLPPEEAIAVEDAPNGAVSATGAGIPTWIMAPRGHDRFPTIAGVQGFVTSLDQLIPLLSA